MAEADDAADGGKPASKLKSKKVMIIAGAALLAVVGGGGAYMTMSGGGDEKTAEDGHGGSGHGEEKADAHGGGGHGEAKAAVATAAAAFVDLPEMTVNLATVDKERQQYVRISVALEVGKAELAEAIKPMLPRVLDAFQVHLREMRASDLKGSSGLYRLKEELLRRVNVAIAPARVDAVLFKDLVVQ